MRLVEGIWGSGADDIYAVGRNGNLSHSTGDGTWTDQTTDTNANLTGIWGSGPDDIYVSVNANVILHSTGDGNWEHQDYEDGYTFDGIWGIDADNVYLVGPGVVRGGAGGWGSSQTVSAAAPTFAIWGSSPTDLYVTLGAAAASSVYGSNGDGSWQPQSGSPEGTAADAIWGLDSTHIWLGAGYNVFFSTGNDDWTPQLTTPAPQRVNAIWGAEAEAVYACTQSGFFYRSNGQGTWSEGQDIDPELSVSCLAIWGTGPDNIYVGTSGGIYHGTAE
jgi:hypothetical protein